MRLVFRKADLDSAAFVALVARHVDGMRAHSPPQSVFALGIEGLRQPEVTVWSAWSTSRHCPGCSPSSA